MSDIVPAIQQIYTNMNVPTSKALPGTAAPNWLTRGLTWGAQYLGLDLAGNIAGSAGRPGGARMSSLGLGGNTGNILNSDAPVYQTPINDVTPEQVATYRDGRKTPPKGGITSKSDSSRVSSDGQTVYSADGSRYTTNGVTYDLATGQAVNPETKEISPGGYSIEPQTGARTDKPSTPAPTGPRPATVSLPLLDLDGINSHLDTILSKGKDWEYAGNTQLADINTFLPGELPTTADNDGNQGATNTEVVVEGATATPQQPVTDPDAGDQPRSVTVPGDVGAPNYGPNGNDPSRRAFLDHPGGSLAGTRAALAARGIYSQGNQYFTNIGGEATQVSKEDYDSYRLGNISAQEFKNRYTADVASTLEPADSDNTGNETTEITDQQQEAQGLPTSNKDEDDDK